MNHYAQALKTVGAETKETLPWKQICIELAAAHPKAFNEAVTKCQQGKAARLQLPDSAWIDEVKAVIEENGGWPQGQLRGIKRYRELFGCSLLDAKTAVQALCQ